MLDKKNKVIKVSSTSPVPQLSGSIVVSVEEGFNVEVRAVGASAVNQMYKALATARSIFASRGLDLTVKPGYDEVEIKGDKRTVMIARIVVK